MEKLVAHQEEVDTFGLTEDDVKALLKHCLHKNVFSFDDTFYRQTLGIAMGNQCAPPIAIWFLDRVECKALENVDRKPPFFVRYIDDYAGIWTHGEQAFLEFLAHLNYCTQLCASSRVFGWRHSDAVLRYICYWCYRMHYYKSRNRTHELWYNFALQSSSSHSTKHSIVRNQFRRAIRNSSNGTKKMLAKTKFGRYWFRMGTQKKFWGDFWEKSSIKERQ